MKVKPTKGQLEFLDWEFGVFFHFGIRSAYMGHDDWDGRPMPAEGFNPKLLDCKQWCRIAKKAGAKYAILVTKHHDGFANWPSKYSDYSVAQSPWQDGKGDVVREFTNACRKYGLKVGLYYSPAQWGGKVKFDNEVEYDDYFINQISELLTNYGKIDYLWFDGCGSEKHEYDRNRIVGVIRSLQPEIKIFSMWDPDTRWVGNEDGYADMPNVNEVDKAEYSIFTTEERPFTLRYLPAECDMKMREHTWFNCQADEDTIKSVDELLGIYEYSVGRGANLLLNIGPNGDGLLPEADAERLLEFGEALRKRYGDPLHFGEMKQTAEDEYEIEAIGGERALVDTLEIMEDITEGEAVREYRVYAHLPNYSAKRICVYRGDNIGHKAICRFPAILTAKLVVKVIGSEGEAKLRSMRAFRVEK